MDFFSLAKIFWLFASPDSLLVILSSIAGIMLFRGKTVAAKRILAVVLVFMVAITLFPVDEWLAYPLEARFPANPQLPEKVDGIIVLGGSENVALSINWNQPEFGDAAERDMAFLALARRYPHAKQVFTGGSGNLQQKYKEADVARDFFASQDFDVGKIIFERDSRNTYENAIFSRRLVHPAAKENWVLITSAAHMPRAAGIFCRAEWKVIPYPVDHQGFRKFVWRVEPDFAAHLLGLRTVTHEWIGLAVYYATGKTSALFPGQCR